MNTKERIMSEALSLFSEKGYDPVSIRDIARAVGIKESSIYNHYANKQDIFDSILREYSDRWGTFFQQMRLTGEDGEFRADDRTVAMYRNMTNEQFAGMASVIFDYYFTDEVNVKLRKMLTIEQYRNETVSSLFRRLSFDESIGFQAKLFEALMAEGCFVKTDPYILALEFFSPIFLLFYKYDKTPQGLAEGKALFLRHIRHFSEVYGRNPINNKDRTEETQ